MSWLVSGWVKKSKLGGGPRKCVMLVVADYCTEDAEQLGIAVPEGHAVCWAGVGLIAAEAEYSEKTVRRVLDDMEQAGVIRRERRHDARGWRAYDLIWVEYARRFADLSDWASDPEPDKTFRSESPVGGTRGAHTDGNHQADGPVDNSRGGARLPDSQGAPSGLSRPGLADSRARPPHPPIRNNPQVEPPTNHQDHLGDVRTDRAPARQRTRSSSREGPAPPATGPPAAAPSHPEGTR